MCVEIRMNSKDAQSEQPCKLMALKTIWNLKSREKTNSLVGERSTTDRGLHHEPNVVSTGSIFFYSSFFLRAWQLRGICGESKTVKARAKRSIFLQNIEKNHTQA